MGSQYCKYNCRWMCQKCADQELHDAQKANMGCNPLLDDGDDDPTSALWEAYIGERAERRQYPITVFNEQGVATGPASTPKKPEWKQLQLGFIMEVEDQPIYSPDQLIEGVILT